MVPEAGKTATAAISLRPLAEQDSRLILAAIRSSDELLEWAGPDLHWPLDKERLRDYGSPAAPGASRFLTLSADESATATLVGHAQFAVNRDHDVGQVARVLIAPAVGGRGLCIALIGEIMRLGVDEMRLHRLGLNVFDGNTAAIACYERADFVKEGHLRDVARASSGDWSVFVLGMLGSDPRPEPSATERGNQRE